MILGAKLAKIKTSRAAVVPYFVKYNLESKDDSTLYFLMARDRGSKEITDLGGGVKKTECALIAGLREFKEETDEIFEETLSPINSLTTNLALLNKDKTMAVLFLPMSEWWFNNASKKFIEKRASSNRSPKKSHNEISELLWIDEKSFIKLIHENKTDMWKRLKNFYRQTFTPDSKECLKLEYSFKYL